MQTLQLTVQTIFSTGLLVLEPVQLKHSDTPLRVTTKLDATNYSSFLIEAGPVQRVYGFQGGNLARPPGTWENLVIETLQLASGSLGSASDSSYAGIVSGFSTGVDCEPVSTGNRTTQANLPWFSIRAPYFLTNVTTGTCNITNIIVGGEADHGYYENDKALQTYQAWFHNVTCNTGYDNSLPILPDNGTDHRFVMSLALLKWIPRTLGEDFSWTWVEDLTVILCKPTYSIDNYTVTYTQGTEASGPEIQTTKIPGTNSTLEGFDTEDLTTGIWFSLSRTSLGSGGTDYVLKPVPTFFILLEAMSNNDHLQPLMNASP